MRDDLKHIQIEVDAAYLYGVLADHEEEKGLAIIYISKGIPEGQARDMPREIISNKDSAHEILMQEDLGINPQELKGSAMEAAITFGIGRLIDVSVAG
jgi:hypothetical protein